MAVLVVAFLALSQSLVASVRMTSVHRETALATDGIGEMIETLQGVEDFDLVYRLYNADPGDDPGPGPAPGSGFAVAGLGAVDGDPDGLVGEIVFPTVASAFGLELREDVVDPALGMPRDLNGNGLVDNYAIAPDEYRLLPVLVRLRWNGVTGERTMVGRTLIADR